MLTDTHAALARAIARAREIAESDDYRLGTGNAQHRYDQAVAEARAISRGADEANNRAKAILDGQGTNRGSNPNFAAELRAVCEPGNAKREMWIRPAREQLMGRASDFLAEKRVTPYLTTGVTTGSDAYFTADLYSNVVAGLLSASGVLEADPTLIVTDHLRPIQVPRLDTDAVATAGVQGAPATDANTAGSHVDLGAFRFDGVFTYSAEMWMASEYDLEAVLGRFAERAIANKVAEQLAMGVGGGTAPHGVFYTAVVVAGITTASQTAVTVDEVLGLMKSIPKGYRKSSKLCVSDVLHTSLFQAKDGAGEYLLRSIEGGGFSFAGVPMYTEPQANQTSMSASEVHAVAGDWSSLFVRTTPMFLKRTDGDDPLNPQLTFATWLDADVVDANGLRSLVMHA